MKISSIVLSFQSYFIIFLITATSTQIFNSTSTEPKSLKAIEKYSYPKKVNLIKKNSLKTSLKKIANITEKFKDLPADDLEFIKELDKQFKLHGGKVKIKVENNNITETKNSKRTIDGELGYGYMHNGYQYDPPKFMFYPYSQQNIASKPNHILSGDGKTEVTIEPSYSYELKPQSYITQNEPQIDVPKAENQHPEQHQHYEEPVIVLRIPGPAKYATHLQMLLQQYLEIRAAQYLRILEEAEQRNNQLQQFDHGQTNTAEIGAPIEHIQQQIGIPEKVDYNQQVQYDHQIAITPQPIQYPDIDNVYHNYKHIHSANQEQFPQQPQDEQSHYSLPQSDLDQYRSQYDKEQQYEHQAQQYQPQGQQQLQYQQEEQPQLYYTHQQQYAQPEGLPANTYQNVYLLSMTPQSNSEYNGVQGLPEKQKPIYVQDQSDQNAHTQSLPITENNPRPSHTKVVFTTNNEHINQEYQMYRLPSIKPNERHPPTSVPDHHQDFRQQYQHIQTNEEQHYNIPEPNTQEVVTITQRPFNYHAHSVKARAKGRTGTHKRRAATTEEADHGLQKIREYVREKLGAETGSAVEFKTTQLLDG